MTKKTYNKKKRNCSGKTITKNIALPHILIIAVLIIQNIVFLCIFFHLHNRYSNTLKNMTAEIGYIEQLNTQMHKMLNTLMIIDIIIIAITAVFAIYVLFSLIARNKQMQKELQKSEMRTLQAQINPHFLYNTLSTVTWMAESGRNSDVVNTTVALSDFFRITLSQGNDWIRLADEIEHDRSYLIIQQKR